MIKDIINVAIADDHELFRKGLQTAFKSNSQFKILFEASDGIDLLSKIEFQKGKVDVILLDIRMPNLDGSEATILIKQKYPLIKILILSMYDDYKSIANLVLKGANGYLLKDSTGEDILKAIKHVHMHGFYGTEIVDNALASFHDIDRKEILHNFNKKPLNEQEKKVMKFICEEKSSAEIAEILCLSARTIEGIRLKIMKKIGVKNAAGLVKYALHENLNS